MKYIPYQIHNNYILRTPLMPLLFLKTLTNEVDISNKELKNIYKSSIVKEAIFLASPGLYLELERWDEGSLSKKKQDRIKLSLLKYLSRMSTRCTPFGLFAGFSLGNFDKKSTIKLSSYKENDRYTRLDMNYLVALSQDLVKIPSIRSQLLYFPNSSLYISGSHYRYVEYHYENGGRRHKIVAIEQTSYLQNILELAKKGATLSELEGSLVNDEITVSEAQDFIKELVESQILISEIEPSVSGSEFLVQIISVLNRLENTQKLIQHLKKIDQKLNSLDKKIGNSINDYLEIKKLVKSLGTAFDLKYLFQTNMKTKTESNTLSRDYIPKLNEAFAILNTLTAETPETNLLKFKRLFKERYENKEVALSIALDVEMGIGYLENQESSINPLVDDLVLDDTINGTNKSFQMSNVQRLIHHKVNKAILNGFSEVNLVKDDLDFGNIKLNYNDLPDTMSSIIKISKQNGKEKIYVSFIGGSSGVNLLGRFCNGDSELNHFANEITEFERSLNQDLILAEIVHLPEARVGNILMRPDLREMEIPYLAKSNKTIENQLTLDDLFISMRNDTIILRSKKLNRCIVPRLSNAHNFTKNALPVYQFLCDMQTQGLRSGLAFGWGSFENEYGYIPRITYQEEIILSLETWHIRNYEIKLLLKKIGEENKIFMNELRVFCSSRNIPKYTLLVDGDNELLIDMENRTSVEMLLSIVKNRPAFKLTEFLFSSNDGIVQSELGNYSNEIVVTFQRINSDCNE